MSGDKPLLLLDVDGVVNAYYRQPGLVSNNDDDWPDAWWHSAMVYTANPDPNIPSGPAQEYLIQWVPPVVDFLNEIHDNGEVEIKWLTTWQNDAKTNLAPVLGFSDFEVAAAIPSDTERSMFQSVAHWWKFYVAERETEDWTRPLIWIDDHIRRWITFGVHTETMMDIVEDYNNLLISPDASQGITNNHIKAINEYLDARL